MSWVRRRIVFPLILIAALAVTTAVLFEVVIRAAAPVSPFVRLLTRTEVAGPEAENLTEFLDLHGVGFYPGRAMGGRFRNRFGLQSPEPSEDVSRRIVAIGDSFVVNDYPPGWMWPRLLEGRLNAAANLPSGEPAVQVLNFALPGIGPGDYEALWELAARDVEPDTVLVSFFIGNDFQNFRALRGEAPPRFRSALFVRNFWRFLRNRANRNEGVGPPRVESPKSRTGRFGAEVPGYEESYDNRQASLAEDYYRALKSEVLNIFAVANQDLLQTEVLRVAEILARICRKAGRDGAACLVVIFPDELQVDTDLRGSLLGDLDRESEPFDFERPNVALAERLSDLGVPTIDVLACLRDADRALYRLRDTHLNRRGNQVAAECIFEQIGVQLIAASD